MPAELEVHFGLNVIVDLVVPMDEVKSWAPDRYNALIESLGTLIDLVHAPKWKAPSAVSIPSFWTVDDTGLWRRADEPPSETMTARESTFAPAAFGDGDTMTGSFSGGFRDDLAAGGEGSFDDVASTPVGDGDGRNEPEPATEGREEGSAGTAGVGERAEPSPAAPSAASKAKRKPGRPRKPRPEPLIGANDTLVPKPGTIELPALGAYGRDLLLMVKMLGHLEAEDGTPLQRTVAERLEVGSGVALSVLERLNELGLIVTEREGRKILSVELTDAGRRELDA